MHTVHRLTLRAQEVIDSAMKSVRHVMSSAPDEGPRDYDRLGDLERRVHRVEHRPHQPSYNNGNGGLSKSMVAAMWFLVASGVCGLVVMYGKLSAIEANQVSQQRQIDAQGAAIATLVGRRP